jgi:N-acetylglucosaminyldiphosphoundecaprenol N-acetyl-beta-D-mannosaminyltransferase
MRDFWLENAQNFREIYKVEQEEMQKAKIFGVGVTVGEREELLLAVRGRVGRGGAVATVNATMLERARRDGAFLEVLQGMLCIPDGVGVRLVLKARGICTEVLPGVELGRTLLSSGAISVGLYGGRDGVAEAAMAELRRENPSLVPAFALDGYTVGESALRAYLDRTRPDVLCLALGSPRQEMLAHALRREYPTMLSLGLGGSFDVWSGRLRRAPRPFRVLGLEWLWRMMREPRRSLGLFALVRFLVFGLFEGAFSGKSRNSGEKAPRS